MPEAISEKAAGSSSFLMLIGMVSGILTKALISVTTLFATFASAVNVTSTALMCTTVRSPIYRIRMSIGTCFEANYSALSIPPSVHTTTSMVIDKLATPLKSINAAISIATRTYVLLRVRMETLVVGEMYTTSSFEEMRLR
eukprot:IDg11971t1